MSRARLAVAVCVVVAVAAFFAAGGHGFFTFENLKAQQAALERWREMHPWGAALGFFAVYIAFTSLSLPAASILTVLAGAIFGPWLGVLLVSFASAIGATLAMLASRFAIDHVTLQPSWPLDPRYGDRRVIPIAPVEGN